MHDDWNHTLWRDGHDLPSHLSHTPVPAQPPQKGRGRGGGVDEALQLRLVHVQIVQQVIQQVPLLFELLTRERGQMVKWSYAEKIMGVESNVPRLDFHSLHEK